MLDELADFTMEAITGVFFADYATPELMEGVKRYMPTIVAGLFSIPVRFPWPLNELALFSFGKAMDAREAFSGVIRGVLEERRADISSAGGACGKSAGVLDSLVETLRGQEGTLDDNFIFDTVRMACDLGLPSTLAGTIHVPYNRRRASGPNSRIVLIFPNQVINIMFAGTDTTASALSRTLQLLATADDGKEIITSLRQELSNEATSSDDNELDDTTGSKGDASRRGILDEFPLLDAVILETFR